MDSLPVSDQQALSGLYVHIPYCQSKCRYCGFYSEPIGAAAPPHDLIEAMLLELKSHASLATIKTIYIGGGSPSSLPLPLLERLLTDIRASCPNSIEFTVESNPGQCPPPYLSLLYEMGVNRLSFGVQSFDDTELQCLGRQHTAQQARQAILDARTVGFENIGLDLIFGIPGSNLSQWQTNLHEAVQLAPTHLSTYSLSYEPGTALQRDLKLGLVEPVSEDMDCQMYETTIDFLTQQGFEHYEISNFAQPGHPCLHNISYWENRPYLGIGPSAASCDQGKRWTHVADIHQYIEGIRRGQPQHAEWQALKPEDYICETAVLGLRRISGLSELDFFQKTGSNLWTTFATAIKQHIEWGYLKKTQDRLHLTQAGLPIADTILCDFATIDEDICGHAVYS